jgi:hypothetical protein
VQPSVLPDLNRPPAGIGPRIPAWVRYCLWVLVYYTFTVVLFALFDAAPRILPVLALALLTGWVLVGVVASYAMYRLGVRRSVGVQALAARPGSRFGDPEADTPRLADRHEVDARRLYRRKKITRVQYERILAHRRFAHGELTNAEYHEVMAFLDAAGGTPVEKVVKRPPAPP